MDADAVQPGEIGYFDGRTNRKRSVTLRLGAALDIVENEAVVEVWPLADVRRADGPSGLLRLRCVSALPLARLEIVDVATQAAVTSACASLDVDRHGPAQTWRIVFWSAAAVCSILLLSIYGIPLAADRLAPLLPPSFERRIGEAVDPQIRLIFGNKICTGAEGRAALTALVEKLRQAGGIEIPLEAQVLSTPIPNAIALPGGRVYLMDGLLQKAQSPDEIAGVLAHELGHVHHRDNLRLMIQTGGTSFLIGLLFGDVTGAGAVIFVGRSVLDASYSREAERSADAFATEVMHKLGRSSKPMGELLFRVTGAEKGKTISILANHPLTEDRLATMTTADRPNTGAEILSEREWRALKNICKAQ